MLNSLSLLTDFYEMTMSNGYFKSGISKQTVYFDMFFRKIPDKGGYAIMAGLEQFVEYINNLKFSKSDIEYLRSKNMFDEKFLEYLENFEFKCDIWAVPEGTPIFPGEPIVTVKGPVIQAQLIETMLLLTINHQSLIATKASRIARASEGRAVMEFGARRAQGVTSAVYGARAAYIGGCAGTSCTLSDKMFGIPALGTMAHSWIQLFPNEYAAFSAYAALYPDDCTLLVDTYNVLKSGIPNAIKVHNEVLVPQGKRLKAIRIDSGDITYLSKKARKMLDEAGLCDCKITASNSLDEYIIRDMMIQKAKIDSFGVGERLITAASEPMFGGVYKLAAVESGDKLVPKIKISENVAKITTPGFKKVYRLFNSDNMAIADVITLNEEEIDDTKPYEIFHPEHTWKKTIVENFKAVPLLKQIFKNGKQVYQLPSIEEIKKNCEDSLAKLWDEVKRFENPHGYYVDLSPALWELKNSLIQDFDKYRK